MNDALQTVLGQLKTEKPSASLTQEFRNLLSTDIGSLSEAEAAAFLVDLVALRSDRTEVDPNAMAIMLRSAERRLVSRGADQRLSRQIADMPAEKFDLFRALLNRAKSRLDYGAESRGVTRLIARIEKSMLSRSNTAALVQANMSAQSAMTLNDTSPTVTVKYKSGSQITLPVFRELERDIGRARHYIVSESGQERPLITDEQLQRFSDDRAKAQAKQGALQAIFAEVARENLDQFHEIARWCQQGAFGFVDKAAYTRNSPFKLPDGTPVCLPSRSYDVSYKLQRQGSDVLVTSTVLYRPTTIARYYQNDDPDAHRPAGKGSQCGVTQTFRIDGSGRVSLEFPPSTWGKLTLEAGSELLGPR